MPEQIISAVPTEGDEKMKKIKVLMVGGSMNVGGLENQIVNIIRHANKEQFQIDYTTTVDAPYYKQEIESLGGKCIRIPDMDWSCPWVYCKELEYVIKNGEYDIVHSHELFHSGITLWIARQAGAPCRFAHAHNWCDDDGTGKKRGLIRSIYNMVMRRMINRYSTSQIACSTWAGRFLYGEQTLTKPSYHLVFNSVDSGKFLAEYGKVETGEFCSDGWANILNVARITAVKNQKFLVEIADEFRKAGDKVRILCAGNGDADYEAEVRREIENRQLGDYIQLLGVRKDIDVLMRKSSAFVLPSKYEGMPLVMIEAQASGLPCVSANTYSPEVDFGIGTVTWLSLENPASKWAEALRTAVGQQRPSKEKVVAAVQEKKFDSRMFAETVCSLYRQDYERAKG